MHNLRSRQSLKKAAIDACRFVTLITAVVCVTTTSCDSRANALPVAEAEEVYSNLQVLTGIPAEQLLSTMDFISASLGVRCSHCHVGRAYEKDEKAAKKTARDMIRMTNRLNFRELGKLGQISCYSCHRGALVPKVEPTVGGEIEIMSGGEAAEIEVSLVFERYRQAIGLAAASARKMTPRISRGTLTVATGRGFPVTFFQRAGGFFAQEIQLNIGTNISVFNGQAGTVSAPGKPAQTMNADEVAAALLLDTLAWAQEPSLIFEQIEVVGTALFDEGKALVVRAQLRGAPVELFFGVENNLLRRARLGVETPLGSLPTLIDYTEYHAVEGVLMPKAWTVSRPQGRFSVEIESLEVGVSLADDRFALAPVSR